MPAQTCRGFALVVPRGRRRENALAFLRQALPGLSATSHDRAYTILGSVVNTDQNSGRTVGLDEDWYMVIMPDNVTFLYAPSGHLLLRLTMLRLHAWLELEAVSGGYILHLPGDGEYPDDLPDVIRREFLS